MLIVSVVNTVPETPPPPLYFAHQTFARRGGLLALQRRADHLSSTQLHESRYLFVVLLGYNQTPQCPDLRVKWSTSHASNL
jgi:hypothetical protein